MDNKFLKMNQIDKLVEFWPLGDEDFTAAKPCIFFFFF